LTNILKLYDQVNKKYLSSGSLDLFLHYSSITFGSSLLEAGSHANDL